MNHVYRVVFNRALGVYQCVSELAKSRGKSASSKSQIATKLVLTPLAIAMLSLSGTAMAVTYDNGQTNNINDNPYVITDDTISGNNTKVNFFDIVIGDDGTGQLKVTNDALSNPSLSFAPEVTSNKVSLGLNKG